MVLFIDPEICSVGALVFLHLRMACHPIYSGKVEFYCIKIMKYWTLILLVVFYYGCETWSFTLRGGRNLG